MQDSFKISVIIPNFNRSEKLVRAINSVLHQTFSVLEILVCDDGSTDDSKSKVLRLNNSKVIWIDCGKNGRPAIPRNIGIKKSKGNWIAFLDNDDEWLPEKINEQVSDLIKYNKVASCTNALKVFDGEITSEYDEDKNSTVFRFQELILQNRIICSSVLIQKNIIESVNYFSEASEMKALEDYGLWLKISCNYDFIYNSKCLVKYEDDSRTSIRKDSLTTEQQLKIVYFDFKKWYSSNKTKCTSNQYSELRNRFFIRFQNRFLKFTNNLFNV
ncbi:MAG: glycosyltransferase family 2 protein [Bacteroidetes bacterium]|nr:glycosyltransferase family 2 protein [Bacteroidota bacterium]